MLVAVPVCRFDAISIKAYYYITVLCSTVHDSFTSV